MESLPDQQNQINELRAKIDGMARRLDAQAAQINKLLDERQVPNRIVPITPPHGKNP